MLTFGESSKLTSFFAFFFFCFQCVLRIHIHRNGRIRPWVNLFVFAGKVVTWTSGCRWLISPSGDGSWMKITEANCTEVLKYLCSYSSSYSLHWCKDYRNWCQGAEFNYMFWGPRERDDDFAGGKKWKWRRKLCWNEHKSKGPNMTKHQAGRKTNY